MSSLTHVRVAMVVNNWSADLEVVKSINVALHLQSVSWTRTTVKFTTSSPSIAIPPVFLKPEANPEKKVPRALSCEAGAAVLLENSEESSC